MLEHALTLALVLALVPRLAAADVIVVDAAAGPGVDFTDLQPAIDAAADGDLLLVRSGSYGSFVIDDRSVSVIADQGADVVVVGTVEIENVSGSRQVVVDGVRVVTDAVATGDRWQVESCVGGVLVQDCEVRTETSFTVVTAMMSVSGCARVSMVRCQTLSPGTVHSFFPTHGAGLSVRDSTASFFDCAFEGMSSQPDFATKTGGDGARVVPANLSPVFFAGSTLTGGDGGDAVYGVFEVCDDAGTGGDALDVDTGESVVLLDSVLRPGAGGDEVPGFCDAGSPGERFAGFGTLTKVPLEARSQHLTSPVRHGETLVATYTGQPGDIVLALYSPLLSPTPYLPETHGPVVPDLSTLKARFLGVVPPDGSLTRSFEVSFPHSGHAAQVFVQGAFLTQGGEVVVSGGESLVYLGPGL